MLRMALLGLLILLSVGMLSAMELRAPPRRAVAIEQNAGKSAHDALAKADRLDVVAVSSEMPTQAALVEPPVAPPEDIHLGSHEPETITRHRHHSKKIATAERPKPKPKAAAIKRTANVQRSKAANNTEPCRLKAFGGLRKALNLTSCEI